MLTCAGIRLHACSASPRAHKVFKAPDSLDDGGERHRAGADTVGQRRGVDGNALAGERVALSVQRLVKHELRHQHARQQVRAGEAARDRVGRGRRLGDALAVAARHLLAHVLDDLPPPRLAFERAQHDVVELAKPGPAASGAGARRRIHDPLHRQVIGQARSARVDWTALAPCEGGSRSRDVGLGLGRPPGSPPRRRWPVRAAPRGACHARRTGRTAHGAAWRSGTSASRFRAGGSALRCAAPRSWRGRRRGRTGADRSMLSHCDQITTICRCKPFRYPAWVGRHVCCGFLQSMPSVR